MSSLDGHTVTDKEFESCRFVKLPDTSFSHIPLIRGDMDFSSESLVQCFVSSQSGTFSVFRKPSQRYHDKHWRILTITVFGGNHSYLLILKMVDVKYFFTLTCENCLRHNYNAFTAALLAFSSCLLVFLLFVMYFVFLLFIFIIISTFHITRPLALSSAACLST